MPQYRHEPSAAQHPDRTMLGGVDDHGIAGLIAEERHHTVVALGGVLHGAFVATDHEVHGAIINEG